MPVDAARELLADHLRAIMAQVLRWHGNEIKFMEWNLGHPSPPHIAVRSTTGNGKSDIGRNELVRLVKAAKAAELPHRIIIAVPTHDLADEANFKMPRGVTTMIWQGRRAKQLGTKEPMCKNLDAVKAAEELGLTVQKAACKHDDMRCPLFETCAYQRQKALARKAGVWGVVIVVAIIVERGIVVYARVLMGLRMGLDLAALVAVERW